MNEVNDPAAMLFTSRDRDVTFGGIPTPLQLAVFYVRLKFVEHATRCKLLLV